jgi:NAD-dependent deacetylase
VRPGVVWFGEALPEKDFGEAEASMLGCDLVVIVGTSGVVYPAAGLPVLAARRGVPVVEVSPAATDLTPLATWSLRTTAAVGLPELVDAAVS